MKLQFAFIPILIGLASYGIFYSISETFDVGIRDIPLLQSAMYIAVASGLYLNVSEINISELLKNKVAIASILLIGVPAKILIPGVALSWIALPSLGAALLCATVIAQIDPILTARNVDPERFSEKSGTILRCWSSFDDPITVLFAFYIVLPLFFDQSSGSIGTYLLSLGFEILICGIVAAIIQKLQDTTAKIRLQKLGVIATCVGSALLGKFLLPAALGLAARPFKNEQAKNRVLNLIFWFSAAVIGGLAVNLNIDWFAGLVLSLGTFAIAQPLVSFFFIRGDSPANFWRIVFGHQNGMTAILLTIAIELATGQTRLMSITIPAVLFIAFFYGISNWVLDQIWLPETVVQTPNVLPLNLPGEELDKAPTYFHGESHLSSATNRDLNDIVGKARLVIGQVANALTINISQKHKLQARCARCDAKLEKLANAERQASQNGHKDLAHQLLVQKNDQNTVAKNLRSELDNHQNSIQVSTRYLNELISHLLDIEHQIKRWEPYNPKNKINTQIYTNLQDAYKLVLTAKEFSQNESASSKWFEILATIGSNSSYLFTSNQAQKLPNGMQSLNVAAKQLVEIKNQLRQYKVSND